MGSKFYYRVSKLEGDRKRARKIAMFKNKDLSVNFEGSKFTFWLRFKQTLFPKNKDS